MTDDPKRAMAGSSYVRPHLVPGTDPPQWVVKMVVRANLGPALITTELFFDLPLSQSLRDTLLSAERDCAERMGHDPALIKGYD